MAAKRKTLSLAEKVDLIRKVESNPAVKISEMARRLGMPASSLGGILKNKAFILEEEAKCGSKAKKRKNMKSSPYDEMEKLLNEWFSGARAQGLPVDGNHLKEKASIIALKLGISDFKASNGWLDRFKKRHGICGRAICGESASVSDETVQHWKEQTLPSLIVGYELKNIYNVDETGLFYHLMPARTLSYKGESCHGGKLSKDRLTVVLCSNADGSDKLEPVVIGKYAKPRCFKNSMTLPCKYYHNKNAWMTSELFRKFLQSFDARMGATNRKVLLFMDQCPAHPAEHSFLRNVTVHFFPPNCTSKLQPLDLGIIHSFKSKYRIAVVRKAIAYLDKKEKMKLNVLQGMHMLTAAWNKVKAQTIANCFVKAGFPGQEADPEDDFADDDLPDTENWTLISEEAPITFQQYVSCDDTIMTTGIRDVEEMCSSKEQVEEEEVDSVAAIPIPSFREAVESFEVVRSYITSFEVDQAVVARINQVERDILRLQQHRPKKQTTLLDFFRK